MRSLLFSVICIFSFSLHAQDEWGSFKNQTIAKMETIAGWCEQEKAHLMMDLIHEHKCQTCVDIGVFSGKSLFPIAKTLQHNGSGKVFAVDAWDPFEAVKGFRSDDPNYAWWFQLDFKYFYNELVKLIDQNQLCKYCTVVKRPSQKAVNKFKDESIDFIHFDGNHNDEFVLQDVVTYFAKVKDGGYLVLNDPNWWSMKRALVFLLERADVISPYSASATYLLFRKNKKRVQNAEVLLITKNAQLVGFCK